MNSEDVIKIFTDYGALLSGHFKFTSGRHGDKFLQFARIAHYPQITERLCKSLAERFEKFQPDLVVGPATGGIVLAYEVAKFLSCRTGFLEKDSDGTMSMKRGFPFRKGWKVVIVEDITTTGGSVKKCIDHINLRGGLVVGVGAIVNRNPGKVVFDVPFFSLAEISLLSWSPEECPLCAKGLSIIDPDNIQFANGELRG
ncbi:MAG: orotate phosphoribosyltransferase [Candidatus Hydrogenedentes bacterium]|nr:orotate phosphoribosyltransferase [Candidatus Hydrogenedentota bacterium]